MTIRQRTTTHPDDQRAGPGLTVVVLAPRGREAALIGDMLHDGGLACELVPDLATVRDRFRGECGPIVVTVEALGRAADTLCRVLEAQEDWSDVPVILFARQERPLPPDCLPLVERSNTPLLRRPVQIATFLTVVRSAVADRRRQYAVRDLLDNLERLNRRNRRRIRQLQRLTSQLSRAEESERRRLASVLHDDLQQLLVGAQYRLNVLDRRLRRGSDVGESTAELRQLLSEAIERSRSLSHELTPPPLREQSLADALRWLAGRMKSSYGLHVEVEGQLGEAPEREDVDVLAYRSVQELLFNVAKHAGTDRAWILLRDHDGSGEIVVRDEGRGFATLPEECDRGDSPGLGLFSIHERIRLLGGDLLIESEPGHGSRFTLRLPRPPERSPAADAGRTPDAAAPQAGQSHRAAVAAGVTRVLVVDDHRYLREGVKALLAEEPDLEVVGEAADGREAVDLAARLEPDVVLLDVAMPVMDGLEAASRLRALHPQLRIIGLSTFSRQDMAERMCQAGADAYFCKSDPGGDLVAAVRGGVPR